MEDLFLFIFIYLLIYFTHSKSELQVIIRKKIIKILDCWMPCGEEWMFPVGARLPSVNASCEPVLFTSAEQSENIIMEGMYPMVSIRDAEPWLFPSPWSQSLQWLLFPNYRKTLQMWLKKWFCWVSDRTVPTEKADMVKRHIILVEKKFTPKTLESYSESWTNLKPESPWAENTLEKLCGDDNLSSQPRSHGNRIPVIFLTTTELANAGNLPGDAVLGKFPK